MLNLLTGRAGMDKTKSVFDKVKQEGVHRPQLLLVPEQASFEMERRLCEENGNSAGRYAQVLSFTRLGNRVISQTGGGAEVTLDEGGRLLTMYAALKAVRANLTIYALPSKKVTFLNGLLATVNELKSCCMTAGDLSQAAGELEGLDGEKLRDLSLILGAYEAMTARGKLDPRDEMTRLAERLRRVPYAAGHDVYLVGFTDFTPQEGQVIEALLRQAHSVTVTLTLGDVSIGEEAVFEPAQRTKAWLIKLAQHVGSSVLESCAEAEKWHQPALAYLERTLFAERAEEDICEVGDGITVVTQPSPREELRWVAGEIRKLVQSGSYRFRDIAVAARSITPYQEDLARIFTDYHIPVFQAEMSNILDKPIFTLITAAMDTVTGGYLYEDVFRYLKTGLTDLSQDDCDQLENYVLTWEIRGSRWTSEQGWTMHPDGYQKKFTEQDRETLDSLNNLRCKVISQLNIFGKQRSKSLKSINEQVIILYSFLESIQLPKRLKERTDRLLEQGEPELAEEYRQLWGILCGGLEQMAELLGEQEADLEEFSHLLRLLLSRYTVGSIPASLDRVIVGDAPRLANRQMKILFLLGAEDRAIPQVAPSQGLLSDRDRSLLEEFGWDLSPRLEEKINREMTIVYAACTQPTHRLYLSWPKVGEGGVENRPSFLIQQVRTLFPKQETQEEASPAPCDLIPMGRKIPVLRDIIEMEQEGKVRLHRLDQAACWQRGHLSPQGVSRIYGEKVAMSASRMDQYRSCHFSYFLKYGLGAQERKPAGFFAPEYGTFVHYVLEHVLTQLQGEGGLQAAEAVSIRQATRKAVALYVQEELGGMEHQTQRFRYLFQRLQRTIQAVVDNVVRELKTSKFQPIAFELGFGGKGDLPPIEVRAHGISLRISGFVDRVDGWVQDGRLYLRVVDYKTGRKSFDFTEIWNGLGMQMLLYLFALEESGEALFGQKIVPAGALYLPAREVILSGNRTMNEETRQTLVDRELIRKGILLEDPSVLDAMEPQEEGSRFLPIKVNEKTGKISGDALASAEKLGRLKRHTEKILQDICQEIGAGNIEADPFWRGQNRNACQYCVYGQACQFEEGMDHRHWIPTVKNSDFWSWIEEEGGEDRAL